MVHNKKWVAAQFSRKVIDLQALLINLDWNPNLYIEKTFL